MFWVTEQILKAHREKGFVAMEIFGPQGIGKTTYALKTLHQVYEQIYTQYKIPGDSWEKALEMTFFDVEDFIPYLIEARVKRKVIPAVLFDDAGIWLEKYAWRQDDIRGFVKLYKMIRTFVSGIIFTTPSPEDIVKNVREKAWFQIKIAKGGQNQVGNRRGKAMLYQYEVRKVGDSLKGVVREKAIDFFSIRLPNHVFEKYEKMRVSKGIDPQIKNLLDYFPKAKQKLEEMGIKTDFIDDNNSGEPVDAD